MTLLALIITLVVVGVVMYLINAYIPMEPGIKKLLNIVVIIVLVLWILSGLGVLPSLSSIRVGV